jgi:hypothetical protein
VDIDPTNIYFKVRKADLLYRSEKYSTALEEYGKINSSYNPGYIMRSIALCYEKRNQPELANGFHSFADERSECVCLFQSVEFKIESLNKHLKTVEEARERYMK